MSDQIDRLLQRATAQPDATDSDWLLWLEGERARTIARLRQIDQILIKHGRLRAETLTRRQR